MKLQTALLASVASGQKMLYINSGDELQKVQCFDDVSALIGESTVKIEECGTEKNKTPCPELQITDDGFLLFRGWSAGHTRTEITCSNNDIEQKAGLVVFQPPDPESIKITGGFEQHVQFDPEEDSDYAPKDFVDYAQCNVGYSYPSANVQWTNVVSKKSEKCDMGLSDLSGCEKDTSGFLESVTLPLNFKLNKNEYAAFECEISYKVAQDGQLKDVTQKLRFPEFDFITFGEVDYPDTGGDDEIVPEITMDTTDEPDEKKHDGEEEQAASPNAEDNVETGNALLGTASGIIILGIIIGLIFFVRKRSRNNSDRDNGGEYKSGNTVESA